MAKKTSRAQPSTTQPAGPTARSARPGMFAGESAFFIDTDPHVVELFVAQGGVVADNTGFESSTYVICDNPDHELCSKAWNTGRLARAVHKTSFIVSAVETGEKSTTTEHVLQPRIVRPKPYAFFPRATPAPITFGEIRHPTPAPVRVAQIPPQQEEPQPPPAAPEPRATAPALRAPAPRTNGHSTANTIEPAITSRAAKAPAQQQPPGRKRQQIQPIYSEPEEPQPEVAAAAPADDVAGVDDSDNIVEQPTFGPGSAPARPRAKQPPPLQPPQAEEEQEQQFDIEPQAPEEDFVPRSPTKISAMFRAGNQLAQQRHREKAQPAPRPRAAQRSRPQEQEYDHIPEPEPPVPARQQPRAAPQQQQRTRHPEASPYVKESFGDVTRRKLDQLRKKTQHIAAPPEIEPEERHQEVYQPAPANMQVVDDDDDVSETIETVPVPQRKRKREAEYLAHPTAVWWDDIENLPDVSLFHDLRWAMDMHHVRVQAAAPQKPPQKRKQKS